MCGRASRGESRESQPDWKFNVSVAQERLSPFEEEEVAFTEQGDVLESDGAALGNKLSVSSSL